MWTAYNTDNLYVSTGYYPLFGVGDTVTSEAKNSLNFF